MNVLSLFDGMSCGQIALDHIGLTPDKYYASEIDKCAMKVTNANFPNTIQLGDINDFENWDIDWSSIDLILAGSPCQGFSTAGQHGAFNDDRSRLFFVFLEILKIVKCFNPDVKFLLENVRMKQEYLDIITHKVGVDPVLINSDLVSAQSRSRYYWANWHFEKPKDKGLLLEGVIENGLVDRKKSYAIVANYFKGGNPKDYFTKSRRQIVFTTFTNKEGFKPCSIYEQPWAYKCDLGLINGFRNLTPIECERLQTVPCDYTNHVSNTQRYKMLGNGWTVDVVAHILESYYLNNPVRNYNVY